MLPPGNPPSVPPETDASALVLVRAYRGGKELPAKWDPALGQLVSLGASCVPMRGWVGGLYLVLALGLDPVTCR